MEMASSEVEMSSCQTFNCVLSRPHERCTQRDNNTNNNKKKNNNNNNVRNIHVAAFEKNLNVFVRDHLENCSVSVDDVVDDSIKAVPECSSNKSSVSDHRLSKTEESRQDVPSSSSSLGSDSDPNSGQPENPSRNAASSLVQIWEARTTQQPPSSNQSLIDSRTSSMGSNALENSESLESVKESEMIQPIEECNNEEEEEEIECAPPPLESGEKDREGVRVMDIIRKLSNDSETITNNDNGSSGNDNSKEVQTTEARSFPQVACSPRIRGRQALADLLVQMTRDREKDLACLRERHCVSKFTNRGRIQSTLRIRCYERCLAIQGRHRSKSTSAGSDSNRSSRGSGVMHLLREKYKANSENIETGASTSHASTRGRIMDKDPHKATEKKVLQETIEKSGVKEIKEVVSAVENAKKGVLSEISENRNGLKKLAGETIQKETVEGKGEKRETKEKVISKESLEGKGEKRESTKEKAIAKESVAEKALVGIAEKVNLWNSDEKMNRRKVVEKGKTEGNTNTERVERNDVLEEATRRILSVESAERSSTTTSKETMTRCEVAEKVVKGKKKEDFVSLESNKSKEVEDGNIKPQGVTTQADSCLRKPAIEEKVLQETTVKSDLKKPTEKESREERREIEEEESTSMGIAEKVNLWNSKEKKNRRKAMEKGKGKTEGKAITETNELLQEASRRISNVETAERSIDTSWITVVKVVGDRVIMDKRKSSGETTRSAEIGGGKKEEDLASVEAKSKDVIEDKNMNPQAVIHGSKERDKERNSSQNGEETLSLRNSEAKSTKEIERQEVTKEEKSVSHGSREKDKERNSLQYGEKMCFLRNSEAKSTKEIERNKSQEVSQGEESASHGSRESAKEKNSSQQDDETSTHRNPNDKKGIKEPEDEESKKVEREETGENVEEASVEFVNDWDGNEMEEEEEEYGDYFNGDDDWIHDISRPRSYWEDLRKERYLEVLNTESEKKDICNLIERRTVSNFLTSDLRQKIDNLMITRVQSHIGVPLNQIEEGDEDEEEWEVECSARNEEDNETEEEPEKTNLEAPSDVCSQSSARSSTMMSWNFRDQDIDKDNEPTTSLSLPEPLVPTNQSTQDMQTISDLKEQMEQLQREMLELRNTVKSCIDMQLHFQKSVTQDLSRSGSSAEQRVDPKKDPLKRKCCVCSEMPVDSLLYRCGHMCTCLKCAHELQWSSKKCPICMAPIVDVVRAFLDS
ncbi:unnamed protein product [Arabidopsis thaliana]|uniref:RING-type domain-containing protein n=1 Tax=Arabidopsis thaliana TaxID=3702 RepID=A0A654FR30_ARATH|nr:unnamed protein product [Arabidopsis thaliana]